MARVVNEADGAGACRIEPAHQLSNSTQDGAAPGIPDRRDQLKALSGEGFPDDGDVVVRIIAAATQMGRLVSLSDIAVNAIVS